MNITALKKIVSDAYAVTNSATVIPRFSTQFTFTDKELLIRIPIYECQPPPKALIGLINQVISTALPHLKKKPNELEQLLLAAAEGNQVTGAEVEIRGVVMSTSVSGGTPVHSVTECRVLIRDPAA
ncbi:MAG TPA: hypothetical protein VGI03_04690 [Verrucomicrobiae bacterium]|jgi:hypothetical protein